MTKLNNKICLVTGGTGLIGQEIVNEFLFHGAKGDFTFNKNISNAKKLCKDRKNIFYYKVNIKQKNQLIIFLILLKKFNKLDVIVNNAGINNPTDFDKIKEKDWDNILAINLKGPFMIMQNL